MTDPESVSHEAEYVRGRHDGFDRSMTAMTLSLMPIFGQIRDHIQMIERLAKQANVSIPKFDAPAAMTAVFQRWNSPTWVDDIVNAASDSKIDLRADQEPQPEHKFMDTLVTVNEMSFIPDNRFYSEGFTEEVVRHAVECALRANYELELGDKKMESMDWSVMARTWAELATIMHQLQKQEQEDGS